MLTIIFFGGFQLLALGIIGEYLGRMYESIKARPIYIIEQVYGQENGRLAGRSPTQIPPAGLLIPRMPEANPAWELTVVMPCLNEARTLARCIGEAREGAARAGGESEIIIADNGSTDGSPEIALRLGARVVSVAAQGYGHALRGGIAAARGRYIIIGDADGSYDYSHLPRFVEQLRDGCDLVMGNRFLGGIQPGAMPWKNRHLEILFCPSSDGCSSAPASVTFIAVCADSPPPRTGGWICAPPAWNSPRKW